MKTSTLASLVSKSCFGVFSAAVLSALALTACQETPESKNTTAAETEIENVPITTDVDINNETETIEQANLSDNNAETEREIDLADLENNIGAAGVTPNAKTTTPSPEQTIKGTQITDVHYRSAAGDTLSVVFETSATGVLNAIVTLPNKPKMTLSAPKGQGNNPTYRSTDGNIQLVSHGGGSSVDLLQNDKLTSYEALSAEAEVVTKP